MKITTTAPVHKFGGATVNVTYIAANRFATVSDLTEREMKATVTALSKGKTSLCALVYMSCTQHSIMILIWLKPTATVLHPGMALKNSEAIWPHHIVLVLHNKIPVPARKTKRETVLLLAWRMPRKIT
jgi:hypothetical protein